MSKALRAIHAAIREAQRFNTTLPLTHVASAEVQEAGIIVIGPSGTINANVRGAVMTREGLVESLTHTCWSNACGLESVQVLDRRQTW